MCHQENHSYRKYTSYTRQYSKQGYMRADLRGNGSSVDDVRHQLVYNVGRAACSLISTMVGPHRHLQTYFWILFRLDAR